MGSWFFCSSRLFINFREAVVLGVYGWAGSGMGMKVGFESLGISDFLAIAYIVEVLGGS